MNSVDVLVVTALAEEFEAAKAVGLAGIKAGTGVPRWEKGVLDGVPPFLWGEYRVGGNARFTVALARPTQMGARAVGPFAASLGDRLRPTALAMCGVCAGNPAGTARGDVVVGEPVYEWDEGKQSASGFQGDHRQFRMDPRWLRAAQDFDPGSLAGYGAAGEDEALLWFLEQLRSGHHVRSHPARDAYFPNDTWQRRLAQFEAQGLIRREATGEAVLTTGGSELLQRRLFDDVDGPQRLPFRVLTAPMASGSAVIADPAVWSRLTGMGMRKISAVEMEAATIATIAHDRGLPWLVAKGVMDHADTRKDDRYKKFAAHASAQVMFALLERLVRRKPRITRRTAVTAAGLIIATAGGLGSARRLMVDENQTPDRGAGPSPTNARSAVPSAGVDAWPPGWPTGPDDYGTKAYLSDGRYQLTIDKAGAQRPRAPLRINAQHVRLGATAQLPKDAAGWGLWCGDANGAIRFGLGVWPDGKGIIDAQSSSKDADQKDPQLGETAPTFRPGENNELEAEFFVEKGGVRMILRINGTDAVEHFEPEFGLGAITVGVYGARDSGGKPTEIKFRGFELARIR